MKNKPLQINVLAPEHLPFRDRIFLSQSIRKALAGHNGTGALVSGYPLWLVRRVAALCKGAVQEAAAQPDVLLAFWNGLDEENDSIYNRAQAFAEAHGAEAVCHVRLHAKQSIRKIRFEKERESFTHDAVFCACPQDAAVAERVEKAVRAFRAPPDIGRRRGGRRLQNLWLCTGQQLSQGERAALPHARCMVVFVSENSVQCPKIDEAVALFAKERGRQYILLAQADAQKPPLGQDDNPQQRFPAQLLTEETVLDKRTGRTLHFEGVPLACDFRGGEVDARQLVRLVAPLFDCEYEDMARRRRNQRVRRAALTALGAAVLATAYIGIIWHLGQVADGEQRVAKENQEIAESNAEKAAQAAAAAAQSAKIAIEEEETAQTAAAEAEEAAQLAQKNAAVAALRAGEAELAANQAVEKANEAAEKSAGALRMETIRAIREAKLFQQGGNPLAALGTLLAATPIHQRSARELLPEAELLLRTLMSQGEVFPLMTLKGATNPRVEGEVLYVEAPGGGLAAYQLDTGLEVEAPDGAPAAEPLGAGEKSLSLGEKTFQLDNQGMASLRDAEGRMLEAHRAHTSQPLGLMEALDGKRLVSYSKGETIVWGVAPGNARVVRQAHEGPATRLWVGTECFATGGQDGKVHIWSGDAALRHTLPVGGAVSSVEIREEAGLVAVCTENGTVSLWQLEGEKPLWSRRITGAKVARLSPDGSRVVVGDTYTTRYDLYAFDYTPGKPYYTGHLLEAEGGETLSTFQVTGLPWYGEIFQDDFFLIGRFNVMRRYSLADGSLLWERKDEDAFSLGNLIIGPDNLCYSLSSIFTLEGEPMGSVYVPFRESEYNIPSPLAGSGAFLSTSDEYSAMINFSNLFQEERLEDYSYVESHRHRHGAPIVGGAYAPNGAYAITASRDGTAMVFGENGPLQLLQNGIPLTWAAFLPDSSAAITLDDQGRLVLWPIGDFWDVRARAEELM